MNKLIQIDQIPLVDSPNIYLDLKMKMDIEVNKKILDKNLVKNCLLHLPLLKHH